MKYRCITCNAIFDEPAHNKTIASLLVRQIFLVCPYCKSNNIVLTDKGKLLLDRKTKIEKIEKNNDTTGIN